MGHYNEVELIEKQVRKCFSSIHNLVVSESLMIVGIKSMEGEELRLMRSITLSDSVELWLKELLEVMQITV